MSSINDGQFRSNILAAGRTGCGKTTFFQKLDLNKLFGDIIKTEWISGIDIDKKRETKVQSYFSNKTEVHVAKEPDELDSLVETFKLRSHEDTKDENVNNLFSENKKLDRLIVMDDISGDGDLSKKIGNFLTASIKFGYNSIYVFHVIVPASQIWKKNYFTDKYI